MRGRGVEPEYLELVGTDDLHPVARVEGDALLAVAARVGGTRLIDNTILRSNGQPEAEHRNERTPDIKAPSDASRLPMTLPGCSRRSASASRS